MTWVGTPNANAVPVSTIRSATLAPRGRSCATRVPPLVNAVSMAPKPRLWLNGESE